VIVFNDPEEPKRKLLRRVEHIDGQHYFVSSDNKESEDAKDSNHFGTNPRDRILAIIDE